MDITDISPIWAKKENFVAKVGYPVGVFVDRFERHIQLKPITSV